MMSEMQRLRDELHRLKEAFDRRIFVQPSLSIEVRQAEWKKLLNEAQPIADKLARAERRAEVLAARRLKYTYEYGPAVQA